MYHVSLKSWNEDEVLSVFLFGHNCLAHKNRVKLHRCTQLIHRLLINEVMCWVSSMLSSIFLLCAIYFWRRFNLHLSCCGTAADGRLSLTWTGVASQGLRPVSRLIMSMLRPVVEPMSWATMLATRATSSEGLDRRPRTNLTYLDMICCRDDRKLAANRLSTKYVCVARGTS